MQCIQIPESPLVVTHKQRQFIQRRGNNNNNSEICIDNDICQQSDYAVYIKNLCKSFSEDGPRIIDNLCMNVKKGTIYGLLGSSGCGKTTVLSCIVGLKSWTSGDVLVLGNRPGTKGSGIPGKRIGYMPQDLALYNQLSIREIFQFYGRIYNMTGTEVRERWAFLNKLLELPTNFKLIGDLSGGQKRRASLALALMHSPELLVLDEPTVGLDPLLRSSIWNHLYNTVNTLGTTIIITTHYIEEARLSNRIGVMRRGHLLVEDSPLNLLSHHKCELLEQVVLQLCRQDEKDSKKLINNNAGAVSQPGNKVEFKSAWNENVDSGVFITRREHELMTWGKFRAALQFDCDVNQQVRRKEEPVYNVGMFGRVRDCALYQHAQRIYGLSMVSLLTFIRYPAFLCFLLLMVSIQGSIALWAVGSKPRNLGIGIVNHDVGNWSYECGLPQHSGNSCDLSALSCKYINILKTDDIIALKPYDTDEAALDQVHLGKLWGYLSFPNNYSQHTLDRAAANKFAFNESIDGSQIHVHLDYSQFIAVFFMAKHFSHSYLEYVQQLAESCDLGGQAEIPLHSGEPIFGNYDDDYTQFIMPGVLLVSLMGTVSSLTALLLVTDRKQGTLDRAHVAGVVTSDVVLSQLITQGIVTIGQIIVWNFVQHFVFGIVNHGSLWLAVLFCLLSGLSGAGLGVFVGVVCNEEVEALIIGVFLTPVFLLFGGTFFPLENMGLFWQRVGYILPTTLSTVSLRSIIVRGSGLMHSTVWPGFVILIAWIIVLPLISAFIYGRKRK